MGFFGIESSSKATHTVQSATDDARLATGRDATIGEQGSITVGHGGRFQEGVDLTGSRGATINVSQDPDLFRAALESIERQGANFGETLQGASAQTSSIVEAVLGKLTELAQSKQTDGESGRNMVILWIALGLLAVVGILFWRKH
jgi:hypothetical protein